MRRVLNNQLPLASRRRYTKFFFFIGSQNRFHLLIYTPWFLVCSSSKIRFPQPLPIRWNSMGVCSRGHLVNAKFPSSNFECTNDFNSLYFMNIIRKLYSKIIVFKYFLFLIIYQCRSTHFENFGKEWLFRGNNINLLVFTH